MEGDKQNSLHYFGDPFFNNGSDLTEDFWLDSIDIEDVLGSAGSFSDSPSTDAPSRDSFTQDGSSKSKSGATKSSKEKRREWNRTNARKSRMRKKFYVDTLIKQAGKLEQENDMLRRIIQIEAEKRNIDASEVLGFSRDAPESSLIARVPRGVDAVPNGSTLLEGPDFSLITQISESQRHFLITDPNAPDNPVVFASQGFYDLTLFPPSEVIGRNCRFLQGKDTDPATVAKMSQDIRRGVDINCVILNYKRDGTPFWNDLFISPLRDPTGRIVHFVGVQANVSSDEAKHLLRIKEKAKMSAEMLIAKHSGKGSAKEDSGEEDGSQSAKRQRVDGSSADVLIPKAPGNPGMWGYTNVPGFDAQQPQIPGQQGMGGAGLTWPARPGMGVGAHAALLGHAALPGRGREGFSSGVPSQFSYGNMMSLPNPYPQSQHQF